MVAIPLKNTLEPASAVAKPLQDLLQRASRLSSEEQECLAARWTAELDGSGSDGREEDSLRMFDLLPVLMWRADADGQCNFFNQAWLEFTGRTQAELQGEGWQQDLHPDDLQECLGDFRRAVDAREPFSIEYRLRHHSGEFRWVLVVGRPYTGPDGSFAGFISTCFDMSEYKRIELALSENQARFQSIFEQSPYGIVVIDSEGNIQVVNSPAEKMFGYQDNELEGQSLSVLIPTDRQARHEINIQRYMQDPHIRPMGEGLNLVARRKDGSQFPVDVTLAPLQVGGRVLARATIHDVSERLQVEQALLESEARFHTIFNEANFGIVLVDNLGRIEEANPAVLRTLGYTAEELHCLSFRELAYPADAEGIYDDLKRLIAREARHMTSEKRYIRRDGQVLWGRLSMSLMHGDRGQPGFILGMLEDITPQREMEAELAEVRRRLSDSAEAERLHLAQELHDGPLQELYAMGYQLRFLEAGLPEEAQQPFEGLHETIHDIGAALRSITGELRPPALAPFGLEKAIRSHAEQLAQQHTGVGVVLNLQPDYKLLSERVRLALFRIYQSAVNNALRHSGASQLDIRFSHDADQIVLEVSDNGRGFNLPNRMVELVRQGHFGIVGAMERAETVGGRLEVRSSPGQGTTIRAVVPRVEELQVAPRERFRTPVV